MQGIRIDNFRGIIPRVGDSAIPQNAAQVATNVDLSAGCLRQNAAPPSAPTSPTASETALAALVATIATPSAPTVAVSDRFTPSGVTCTVHMDYYEDGVYDSTLTPSAKFAGYTPLERGYLLRFHLPKQRKGTTTIGFDDQDETYTFTNPRYQVTIGGTTIPSSVTTSSPMFDSTKVTLYKAEAPTEEYADAQIINVEGGEYTRTLVLSAIERGPGNFIPAQPIEYGDYDFQIVVDMGFKQPYTQNFYYVITNVDTDDREGAPSDKSDEVTRRPGQKVTITVPSANKNRIYRSAATETEADFYFVGEVAAGTTTFVDDLMDGDLEETVPEWGTRPADLFAHTMMGGYFMAAAHNNATDSEYQVYFSDVKRYTAWPEEWAMAVEDSIVGLAVVNHSLYVLTSGDHYIISGKHPDELVQDKLLCDEPCAAKLSIFTLNGAVFFAGTNGLVMVQGGVGRVITSGLYSPAQWAAFTPSGMKAVVRENEAYIYTTTTTGLVLRFDGGSGLELATFNTAAGVTWQSRDFIFPTHSRFNVMRLMGTGTGVGVKVYADGALDTTTTVNCGADVRLPVDGKEISVELSFASGSGASIDELLFLDTPIITADKHGVSIRRRDEAFSWVSNRIRFQEPTRLKSARILTNTSVDMVLRDKAGTALVSKTVTNSDEIDLDFATTRLLTEYTHAELCITPTSGAEQNPDIEFVHLYTEREYVPRYGSVVIGGDRGYQSFRNVLLSFGRPVKFVVVRAIAEGAVSLAVKKALPGAAFTTYTKSLSGSDINSDVLLTWDDIASTHWLLDVTPSSAGTKIHEVTLFPREVPSAPRCFMRITKDRALHSWLGHCISLPTPRAFVCGRVIAENYPVSLTLYPNATLASGTTVSVTSDAVFRVPKLRTERFWLVNASSTYDIHEVVLAESVHELG